jgi:hypothetical protein
VRRGGAVGPLVGEHGVRERERAVARLGQRGDLHDDDDLEPAGVDEPVHHAGREPQQRAGRERDLGEARAAQRLDRARAGGDEVGLGAGEVDVRAPAVQAVRPLPVVDPQAREPDAAGQRGRRAGQLRRDRDGIGHGLLRVSKRVLTISMPTQHE